MTCRSTRYAVLAIAALAGGSGCARDGSVLIKNDTGTEFVGELNDRGFALSGFESIQLSVKIGTQILIFGPDTKDVTLSGESCTKFPFSETVTVESGDTRQVTIQPDAVCVILQNQSERVVPTVQQRDGGATDWGPNLLEAGDTLFPTESIRRRLAPGLYDFRLIDDCPDTTTFSAQSELIGGTIQWVTHVAGQEGCITDP